MEIKIHLVELSDVFKVFVLLMFTGVSFNSFSGQDISAHLPVEKDPVVNKLKPKNKDPIILLDSTVVKDSDFSENLSDVKKLGIYRYEFVPGKLKIIRDNESFESKNELKLARSADGSFKITDGSLIVEFKKNLDFSTFAQEYGLILTSNLSTINRAVFATSNFIELKNIIKTLRLDARVQTVELNTIDPSIKPQ